MGDIDSSELREVMPKKVTEISLQSNLKNSSLRETSLMNALLRGVNP